MEGGRAVGRARNRYKKEVFGVHYPGMLVMLACNHMLEIKTCHGCTGQQLVRLLSHGIEFVMCSAGTGGWERPVTSSVYGTRLCC